MAFPSATSLPAAEASSECPESHFVNGMRLSAGHWVMVALFLLAALWTAPSVWRHVERFETGPDYRIPYPLSKDYWLYERRLERRTTANVAIVGDSVVWGEYVRPDGTLSHFLNEACGQPGRFMNAGVNGLFPLALEGLLRHDGQPLQHAKVILHCNVLWMTSPKADLSTEKEQPFNHADLVPQFSPRIPCYRADLNRRLVAVLERGSTFLQWANHLQIAYFNQKNILAWTLEEDGGDPPHLVNAFKNPLAQISWTVPPEPAVDPDRGPSSPRHRPWSLTGEGSTRFEWVPPDRSLQWEAFQRLVHLLRARGNDLLVVIGPFNEHMMAQDNRPAFRRVRDSITDWLTRNQVPHVAPNALPSVLYADASHPLTEGYRELADRLHGDATFRTWLDAD